MVNKGKKKAAKRTNDEKSPKQASVPTSEKKEKARAPGTAKADQPAAQRIVTDGSLFRVQFSSVRLVYVWPHTKTSPKHLRAAQAAAGDFNQLAAIGISVDEATARLKIDPTLTAVDDIREALEAGNPGLLVETVRVYPFANLITNAGFVGLLQGLQQRARGGDPWAKKTLKAVGEHLGASGKGQTPHYAEPERTQRRKQQNRDAQRRLRGKRQHEKSS